MDGSPGAEHALRWAAEEARVRKARLHAVLAWEPPVQTIGGAGWIVPDSRMLEEYAEHARRRLGDAVAAVGHALDGIEVEQTAMRGVPSAVLIEAAEGAVELVVGTRGHGGFAELLLGSVSHQCSQHAPCPVVIVRPNR